MRVAYLCDGHGCKKERPSCTIPEFAGMCRHTTDPEHAVNGACEDPKGEPERFLEFEPGVFVEKDCESLRLFNEVRTKRAGEA